MYGSLREAVAMAYIMNSIYLPKNVLKGTLIFAATY